MQFLFTNFYRVFIFRFLHENDKHSSDEDSAWWPVNKITIQEYNKYYLSKYYFAFNISKYKKLIRVCI
jgi:hypothetical protein